MKPHLWLWTRLLAGYPKLERGQGLMEYELIMALVAVVLIVLLVILGGNIQATYQFIIDNLPL